MCRRLPVRRLGLFGSALSDDFSQGSKPIEHASSQANIAEVAYQQMKTKSA
jgi:hypothetical protein